MTEKSDYELLNGDSDDFGELYQRYSSSVKRALYFYRVVRNRVDANDILQLLWLRVYQNRDKYNPKWVFGTWVTRLGIRVAFNFYRYEKPTLTNNNEHLETIVDYREYRDYVEVAEIQGIVREAVSSLPENAREAIEAIYLRQTDLSRGQHAAGYRRGRRLLHKALEGF